MGVFLDNAVVQPKTIFNVVTSNNTMYFSNFDYNQMPNNLSPIPKLLTLIKLSVPATPL